MFFQLFGITCDNASSVIKAFKIEGIPLHSDRKDNLEVEAMAVGEPDVDEGEIMDDDEYVLDEEDEKAEEQANYNIPSMERNPCLAHLTQLAIKDALTKSEFVNNMIKRANDLVTFFHRSNHYYTKLRQENGNIALVKPCVTRWNSQYSCLKRIVEKVSFCLFVSNRDWKHLFSSFLRTPWSAVLTRFSRNLKLTKEEMGPSL